MKRPRILITLDHSYEPNELLFINRAFLDAITNAGGEAILIGRPSEDEIISAVEQGDGLLLSGGDDVWPPHYDKETLPHFGKRDPGFRDEIEFSLLAHATKKRIPILGICRGLQVINVFYKGTLFQDIKYEKEGSDKHDYFKDENGERTPRGKRVHQVSIKNNSLLAQITQKAEFSVNSLHHQGIDKLGEKLNAVAHATDDLIEGIEDVHYPFLLGVQWHPEELNDDTSRAIFQAFIAASRKVATRG